MYDVSSAGTVRQLENLASCSQVTLDEYQRPSACEAILSLAFRGAGHAFPLPSRGFRLDDGQVVVAILAYVFSPIRMYRVSG